GGFPDLIRALSSPRHGRLLTAASVAGRASPRASGIPFACDRWRRTSCEIYLRESENLARPEDSVTKITLGLLRTALQRERRSNTRLRHVIAEVEHATLENRRHLELQFTRIAQLQAEVDRLKKRNEP